MFDFLFGFSLPTVLGMILVFTVLIVLNLRLFIWFIMYKTEVGKMQDMIAMLTKKAGNGVAALDVMKMYEYLDTIVTSCIEIVKVADMGEYVNEYSDRLHAATIARVYSHLGEETVASIEERYGTEFIIRHIELYLLRKTLNNATYTLRPPTSSEKN